MYPALQELIHQAESQYLQTEDIEQLRKEVSNLKERITVYKTLRDQEIDIFQNVAEKLEQKLPEEKTSNIEDCLHQWLIVTRYCAMAMLLNNPEFLERRLLEWLTDIVEAHQSQSIFETLHSLLMKRLGKVLSVDQLLYIKPFLNQAKSYLTNIPVSAN